MAKVKAKARQQLTPDERTTLEMRAVGVTEDRRRHDVVILEETMTAGQRRARVRTECTIDRYHERMQINDRQHGAGIKLRGIWQRAAHVPAVTGSYGESRGNGGGIGTGIDARAALRDALEGAYLAKRMNAQYAPLFLTEKGKHLWMERMPSALKPAGQVAEAVCGLDEWAGGTMRLMLLREALTALADYWKISG